MTLRYYLSILIVLTSQFTISQTVWKKANGTITFTKAAFADWKLAANQDRISDSVWITRASTQSIFNIRKDTAYATDAPKGTLWAFGTTDSLSTRSYKTFVALSNGSPQGLIGKDMVLQLVAEKIFLDIKITAFAGGNTGGAFEYIRAKQPGTSSVPVHTPVTFGLEQNFPNPFNPGTTIRYHLSASARTTLSVFDIVGRKVAEPVNALQTPGEYSVRFDGSELPSGIYLARLTSGGNTHVRRMVLLK